MEGILELLPSVLEGPSVHHLQNYLEACDEHVAFHGKADKKNEGYIKLVNVKLNENDTRLEGLLILRVALQQCSVEVFVDNASSWMSQCVKGSFDRNCRIVNISFSVLGTLLKTAVKFPEIKKYAATNIVPSILEHSKREINVETIYSVLECLIVCIQEYPGPCGECSRFILNLLTRLLNAEPHLLLLAARCYSLLSQVKGKGREGISPQNIWKNNQLILVHTLHHYLDLLFSNVDEIQTSHRLSNDGIELLINKEINKNASSSERIQHIMKCIKGLSKFLKALLVGSSPVVKTVVPDVVIGLVCRGLAVTCHSLGNITTDALALGSVLPEVHADLIDVLIALIACCGRNLIPYGSIICKLLNQELKWTNTPDWPYAFDKPFRNLRSSVYNCLHCWLSTARSASSIEIVIEDIVLYILQDIRMDKQVVTLKAKGGSGKKNQSHYNFSSDTRSDKLGLKFANKELVLSGLKCLQLILYSSSVYMKSTLCKVIQESVITLLLEVQQTHNGPPIPYSDGACRKELYSILLALCMEPHPTFPPPINYALAIFKRGVTDSFMELSVLCVTAISNLEKIIHPSAPPLGNTLQYDTLRQYSGELSNKDDSLLSDDINNTPPSIKDMPLSAFPNLNNVIVLKVYDNKRNFKESNGGNEEIYGYNCESELSGLSNSGTAQSCGTKSIEKSIIHLNGSNAVNQNCNLRDIISMDNSFVCNASVLNSPNDNLHGGKSDTECDRLESVVNLEKQSEKSSIFEKINGIINDDVEKESVPSIRPLNLNNELEKSQEVLQESTCVDVNPEISSSDQLNLNSKLEKSQEVLKENKGADVSLGISSSNEPPLKKLKVSENGNEEKADDIKTSELVVSVGNDKINGETNSLHDEDEMMNCFVDTVQE